MIKGPFAFPWKNESASSAGMTLMDYFAAKVLAAYIISDRAAAEFPADFDLSEQVRCSYRAAYAMMEERIHWSKK